MLHGPAPIRELSWVGVLPSSVCVGDVNAWPYSVGILVKCVTSLGTLHWPAAGADLEVGGVCYVELLILYEPGLVRGLFSQRLSLVIESLVDQFQCRLFLWVQALIFGVLVE